MLIDWFTVGAQALNFAILVWLMKRFLYQPILDAIDAREQRIATELARAGRQKKEAQPERDAFQRKNDDFDQQRAGLLKQAGDAADAARAQLTQAARQAADTLAAKHQAALVDEARALAQALRQRAQTEVFAIARQALRDLASADLEASACAVFITRLRSLEGAPRDALAAALGGAEGAILVRTAFNLPDAQRPAVHQALLDGFGLKAEPRFETAPALVSGIELVAGGEKFAWSIGDYLASLERGVAEVLAARSVQSVQSVQAPAPAAVTATP